MTYINFFDRFKVELQGRNSVREEVEEYYQDQLEEGEVNADIKLVFDEFNPDPDYILGDPTSYYGREKDKFVIREGRGFIRVNRDWDIFECTESSPLWFIRLLIEAELRRKISSEFAIMHASALELDGETYVFPAWRHTGKTNTLLTCLREGADYMSDDRVFVSASGKVRGFSVPLHILGYNILSFPEISVSRKELIRSSISRKIEDFTKDSENIFLKSLKLFNRSYLDNSRYVPINDLFPEAEFVSESEIDHIFVLQTTDRDEMRVHDGVDNFSVRMSAINSYEWNRELREIYSSYDVLFNSNREDIIDKLESDEKEVWEEISDLDINLLEVPREEDWDSKELSEEIIEKLQKLS